MLTAKYLNKIKKIVLAQTQANTRAFIFGSSLTSKNFADVDIGILDKNIDDRTVQSIKDAFEESDIPYKIDLINFARADKTFQKKVLNGKILWLTQKKNLNS